MKDKRPVNLDISTIQLPLPAITSILHRISGVIIFVGIGILLWIFETSIETEAGFNALKTGLSSPFIKFLLWGIFSALAYHLIAGCKHLLMDIGLGESLAGGLLGAKLTIFISTLGIIVIGIWIW